MLFCIIMNSVTLKVSQRWIYVYAIVLECGKVGCFLVLLLDGLSAVDFLAEVSCQADDTVAYVIRLNVRQCLKPRTSADVLSNQSTCSQLVNCIDPIDASAVSVSYFNSARHKTSLLLQVYAYNNNSPSCLFFKACTSISSVLPSGQRKRKTRYSLKRASFKMQHNLSYTSHCRSRNLSLPPNQLECGRLRVASVLIGF